MIVWKFTDPLGIADDYTYYASEAADEQRFCDRAWLLVRELRYPVFHDPTLPSDVIHVTRFDPHDMRPIEPAEPGDLDSYARSSLLRPCIYVADAEFIRDVVRRGNPPLSPRFVMGGDLV